MCAVVTGRLLDGNGGGTAKQAELVSAQGYEPFGSLLPGRNYSSDSYQFGFNSQEKDDEIYESTGTSYTAEFWQYDSRLARRWNLDPVDQIAISNYATFLNRPISINDPNGDCPTCPQGEAAKEIYAQGAIVENNAGAWRFDNGSWIELPRSNSEQSRSGPLHGFTLTSDLEGVKGSNNADRKGLPSENLDVSAFQGRASSNPGPLGHGSIKLPTSDMSLWEKLAEAFNSWMGLANEIHPTKKGASDMPSLIKDVQEPKPYSAKEFVVRPQSDTITTTVVIVGREDGMPTWRVVTDFKTHRDDTTGGTLKNQPNIHVYKRGK